MIVISLRPTCCWAVALVLASAATEPLFPESLLHRRLQNQMENGEITPPCPPGYVDGTGGKAYWWDCGSTCPGGPLVDANCSCACIEGLWAGAPDIVIFTSTTSTTTSTMTSTTATSNFTTTTASTTTSTTSTAFVWQPSFPGEYCSAYVYLSSGNFSSNASNASMTASLCGDLASFDQRCNPDIVFVGSVSHQCYCAIAGNACLSRLLDPNYAIFIKEVQNWSSTSDTNDTSGLHSNHSVKEAFAGDEAAADDDQQDEVEGFYMTILLHAGIVCCTLLCLSSLVLFRQRQYARARRVAPMLTDLVHDFPAIAKPPELGSPVSQGAAEVASTASALRVVVVQGIPTPKGEAPAMTLLTSPMSTPVAAAKAKIISLDIIKSARDD